jgi:hypothetical protein
MKRTSPLTATAVLAMLLAAPAFADDSHHPPGNAAAPATPAPVKQVQPQAQPQSGMPMGMMNMMGGSSAMICPMMGTQGTGAQGMADMAKHMDGHIAFLKAELKITPAQEAEWKAFTEALRTSATNMASMQGMMGGSTASVGQSFEQKERLLTTRLENTKRLHAAWTKLDATLTAEQRQAAQQVLVSHLLMM